MEMERSSSILLLGIAILILSFVLGALWWFHRTDEAPKPPLHSALRPSCALNR
jgi:hypothetical protein